MQWGAGGLLEVRRDKWSAGNETILKRESFSNENANFADELGYNISIMNSTIQSSGIQNWSSPT
jgi:hypothetical protein